MGLFKGKYKENADGTISYEKGLLQGLLGGGSSQSLSAIQYNQALKRQNTLDQFNMNLSNRQQALSEESYYNGVSNQASQLRAQGINPASAGQSLSGMTMSGGSSAGSQSSLPDMTSAALSSQSSLTSMLSLLATISQNKESNKIAREQLELQRQKQSQDYSIAQQNVDISSRNADVNASNSQTQRDLANNTIRLGNKSIEVSDKQLEQIQANIEHVNSQRSYQDMINESYKETNDLWKKAGLNTTLLQSVQNVNWQVGLALGVANLFTDAVESSDSAEQIVNSVESSVDAYNNLSPRDKALVDTAIRRTVNDPTSAFHFTPLSADELKDLEGKSLTEMMDYMNSRPAVKYPSPSLPKKPANVK